MPEHDVRYEMADEFVELGIFRVTPASIRALADSVRRHWATRGQGDKLVMSFHGMPERTLRLGDPYHCHCQKTARLLSVFGIGNLSSPLLLATFTLGIGAGSLLCERLSGRQVEIGLVPFGSIGLTLFGLDLALASMGVRVARSFQS